MYTRTFGWNWKLHKFSPSKGHPKMQMPWLQQGALSFDISTGTLQYTYWDFRKWAIFFLRVSLCSMGNGMSSAAEIEKWTWLSPPNTFFCFRHSLSNDLQKLLAALHQTLLKNLALTDWTLIKKLNYHVNLIKQMLHTIGFIHFQTF